MQTTRNANRLKKQLEDWSQINWRKVIKAVRNLRQRIFRASQLGNFRRLRSLQKLMQRNYANLLLSVRQITQVNNGKQTAGVDKEVINIALRKHVRTVFECGIDTATKVIKFIPSLPHPILQDKPPMLDLI